MLSVCPTVVVELHPELPLVPLLVFVPFVTVEFVEVPLVSVTVWFVEVPLLVELVTESLTPLVWDSPVPTLWLPVVPLVSVVLIDSVSLLAVEVETDSEFVTELATLSLSL